MFSKDALKGQRILVTGGGSGLGKEMSRHFLKHGSEVVICGRRESVLEDTVKELTDETVEDLFLQMVRHFYSKHHRDNNK